MPGRMHESVSNFSNKVGNMIKRTWTRTDLWETRDHMWITPRSKVPIAIKNVNSTFTSPSVCWACNDKYNYVNVKAFAIKKSQAQLWLNLVLTNTQKDNTLSLQNWCHRSWCHTRQDNTLTNTYTSPFLRVSVKPCRVTTQIKAI